MELRSIPWSETREPGEGTLRNLLESEGFEVHAWRDPADRIYGEHHHDCDESLCVVRGSIRFEVSGREFALGPGDRLLLPAGVAHRAKAGPDGVSYLIGCKRSAQRAEGERSSSGSRR